MARETTARASSSWRAGAGQILYAASERGPTVYTGFIATRERIARDRAAFAAITRAVKSMQAWLGTHGPGELAALTAPYYPDVPPDILAGALRRYGEAGIWAGSPDMSREGFGRLAESLVSGGFLKRMPSYEECVAEV